MKKIITLAVVLFTIHNSNSQITLEQSYPDSSTKMIGVNLANSGFKYQYVDISNSQVILYNANHSIFKTMTFEPYPNTNRITIWYTSENTFDLDNEVEFMVSYNDIYDSVHLTRIYNENGTVLFERINEVPVWLCENEPSDAINAIYTTPTGTKMILNSSTDNSAKVYSLPGSMPLALNESTNQNTNFDFKLFPNPIKNNKMSIAYTLPENVKIGNITIYNMSGQVVKTFKVDNSFNTIELNTENLASGTYICEVSGNTGRISTSQFIVQN